MRTLPARPGIASTSESAEENPSPFHRFLLSETARSRSCRSPSRGDGEGRRAPVSRARAADGRASVAEDEVVGADACQLELRLLDQNRVSTGSGIARSDPRSPRAARRTRPRSRPARCGDGGRSSAPRRDVGRRDVGVDLRVDADRTSGGAPLAGELRDRLGQQLHGSSKPTAETSGLLAGSCPRPGSRSRMAIAKPAPSSVWSTIVARRARASGVNSASPDRRGGRGRGHPSGRTPADLVELGEPEQVGALDDQRVRLRDVEAGLDVVVETRTSASPRRNESILSSSSRSAHLSVRDRKA